MQHLYIQNPVDIRTTCSYDPNWLDENYTLHKLVKF